MDGGDRWKDTNSHQYRCRLACPRTIRSRSGLLTYLEHRGVRSAQRRMVKTANDDPQGLVAICRCLHERFVNVTNVWEGTDARCSDGQMYEGALRPTRHDFLKNGKRARTHRLRPPQAHACICSQNLERLTSTRREVSQILQGLAPSTTSLRDCLGGFAAVDSQGHGRCKKSTTVVRSVGRWSTTFRGAHIPHSFWAPRCAYSHTFLFFTQ